MKILVAEDNTTLRLIIKSYLKDSGHQVIEAKNGIEAIELFKTQNPDLLLLDINMPGLDGYEVTKKIREPNFTPKWVPIVFLSGLEEDKDILKGITLGGDDYLTKPVSKTFLLAKIHAMQRLYKMREELKKANDQLALMNFCDGLTGIYNRRKFDISFQKEWKRARRNQQPLGLLLIDIDWFKQYNDQNGHLAGDDCIRKVGQTIKKTVNRTSDIACRYGGEEFAVILSETDNDGTFYLAEKVCAAIRTLRIFYDNTKKDRYITVSIGAGSTIPDRYQTLPKTFFETIDQLLYCAKKQGRDQVVTLNTIDKKHLNY